MQYYEELWRTVLSKKSQVQASIYCKILFYKVLGQANLKHGNRNENPCSFVRARGRLDYKGTQGHLSYMMMDMFCILIEKVRTFVRTCQILYVNLCVLVYINYTSVKAGLYILVNLNFCILLSFWATSKKWLRNLSQQWKMAAAIMKHGRGGVREHRFLVLLSFLPSQAVWSPSCACPTEGWSLSVGTQTSLSLPLLPLTECLEVSHIPFTFSSQGVSVSIIRYYAFMIKWTNKWMSEWMENKLLSTSKKDWGGRLYICSGGCELPWILQDFQPALK